MLVHFGVILSYYVRKLGSCDGEISNPRIITAPPGTCCSNDHNEGSNLTQLFLGRLEGQLCHSRQLVSYSGPMNATASIV
jgi:hypothetical protein